MERVNFYVLPEGCIANIISLTSPREACRLALVSPIFRSAADSDAVWERFLPSDYQTIISQSANSSLFGFSSKKELYFKVCNNPLIIDDGKKSFSLEKWSGKKCYMLAARNLSIVWGDTPQYWSWISPPESRFSEVAELIGVCWLEIRGEINSSMLSLATRYTAYLVFKMTRDAYGFDSNPAEVSVGIIGGETCTRSVCLDPDVELRRRRRQWYVGEHEESRIMGLQSPKMRRDGWLEIELGEFFNEGGDAGKLEMSVKHLKRGNPGNWKSGLIVQGIEIRPQDVE